MHSLWVRPILAVPSLVAAPEMWPWAGPYRHMSHVIASGQITAVNNLLSDLLIWGNSVGSRTQTTFWTASHCFILKSILLQNHKVLPCCRTFSGTSHGTLHKMSPQQWDGGARCCMCLLFLRWREEEFLSCFSIGVHLLWICTVSQWLPD